MKKFLALALCLAPVIGSAQIIYSNNVAPGDDFTNSGTTGVGQAVGSSGWYYNNVRNNGHVGINDTYARSGNGSVYLSTTQGPSGNSSKADIEYFTGSPLGKLSDITALSYDWLRDSVSANSGAQHPAFRLMLSENGSWRGYLIFEAVYNGVPTAPTDTWTTETIGGATKLWSSAGLAGAGGTYGTSLSQWQAAYGNYDVIGISLGVGSGWGTFEGAVDNVTFGFNGQSQTFNFEVASANPVPEPFTVTLGIAGAIAAIKRRRKK